jgi:hypothetical protein
MSVITSQTCRGIGRGRFTSRDDAVTGRFGIEKPHARDERTKYLTSQVMGWQCSFGAIEFSNGDTLSVA